MSGSACHDDDGDDDIVFVNETTSTQDEVKARALAGARHGTAVVAVVQHAGRGRRGRLWSSGPHGLWMSMLLRTDVPMASATRLPLAICARVLSVLHNRGARVLVKWPNDFMVHHAVKHPVLGEYRKCGGLLVEAIDIVDQRLRTAVVGLGLNLTTPIDGFDDDLRMIACTLEDAGDRHAPKERSTLAKAIHHAMRDAADDTDDKAFAAVQRLLSRNSATLGRRVSVDGVSGTATGIADDGALLIEDDRGHVHAVHAGDVVIA